MLDASTVTRLTQREALRLLPKLLLGLLERRYEARIEAAGPGPRNRVVHVSGPDTPAVALNIQDWELLYDAILGDPEDDTDGEADPSAPPPPDELRPYRMGAYLPTKKATGRTHAFNPRTPINRALLRQPGAFEARIKETLRVLFPR